MAENTGEAAAYTAPDGFYSKPIWQRALVIAAGPFMSFVLGYAVFCLMGVTTGVPTGKVLTRISLVEPGGEGHRIGLHAGDVITAINGKPLTDGRAMIAQINGSVGKPLLLTVRRDGQTLTKTATPRPAIKDDKPVIYTDVVQPGSFGQQIGLQPGDTLTEIASDKGNVESRSGAAIRSVENSCDLMRAKSVHLVVARVTSDKAVTSQRDTSRRSFNPTHCRP